MPNPKNFITLENFHNGDYPYGGFKKLAAYGERAAFRFDKLNSFKEFKKFTDQHQGSLIVGYFSYDLKNQIESLNSNNADYIKFPEGYFFVPEISDNKINLSSINFLKEKINKSCPIYIKPRVSKEEYIENVKRIKKHILDGDVYELNYCTEFYAEEVTVDPVRLYNELCNQSPVPFSCLLKVDDNYLICASPERFLKKTGIQLVSQPIKGTIRRGKGVEEDELLKKQLLESEKERAENLMIVDLVRNDLAKSSKTGSVDVEELFGIYSFNYVHQMISTITSELDENIHFVDAIKNAFPPGSMTGAPKIKAMELIEKYETTKRGLYSGAVGYITPDGDFDFNVVIRSILYNEKDRYLSFQVGSAITCDANPEYEYNECLLKAEAIIRVLENH